MLYSAAAAGCLLLLAGSAVTFADGLAYRGTVLSCGAAVGIVAAACFNERGIRVCGL